MPELIQLAPGTVVDDGLPAGWSHLVVKSIPHLTTGDLRTLPGPACETATLFRVVVLADVGGNPRTGFHLRRVGVGLCMPTDGVDVVVRPGDAGDLGPLERLVLDRSSAQLDKACLAGRTHRMALLSTPANLLVDGSQRKILLRYALWVDQAAGVVHCGLWPIAAEAEATPLPLVDFLELPPALVFDCRLHVAARRILGTVPVGWSIAMDELPPGRSVPMPPELRTLAERDTLTPVDAEALERAILAAW